MLSLIPNTVLYLIRCPEYWRVPHSRTKYGLQMRQHFVPSTLNELIKQDISIENMSKYKVRQMYFFIARILWETLAFRSYVYFTIYMHISLSRFFFFLLYIFQFSVCADDAVEVCKGGRIVSSSVEYIFVLPPSP